MQWYKFVLERNDSHPKKEISLLKLLRELVSDFRNGDCNETLLLYRIQYNLKDIDYYFTCPNKYISKIFVQQIDAEPCELPEIQISQNHTEVKFLAGDMFLWNRLRNFEGKVDFL